MKQTRVSWILKIEENDNTYTLITPNNQYPLEKEYAIKMVRDFGLEAKKPVEPPTREQALLLVDQYLEYTESIPGDITLSMKGWIELRYKK